MLQILGMGWALPKNEISSEFLHRHVGLERDLNWVKSRLGIDMRYSVLTREYISSTHNRHPMQAIVHARSHGQTPTSLATAAGAMAIKNAGLRPDQIGMVMANVDSPFDLVPSGATAVAKALGVPHGPHVEMNSACSSFALHMHHLSLMNPDKLPEFILTFQTACYTTRVDYSPKCFDGYIWGDGAAAQVVSTRHQGRISVEPMMYDTAPEQAHEIHVDTAGFFSQNGAAVREFSIRKTCEMYEQIAAKKELYADEVYTVSHQAKHALRSVRAEAEKKIAGGFLSGGFAARKAG